MYAANDKFAVVCNGRSLLYITIIEQTAPEIKTSNDIWYKCIDCDTGQEIVLPQCYIQQYGVKCD